MLPFINFRNVSFVFILIASFYAFSSGYENVAKLPNCHAVNHSGYILVSTLDGKFSALNPSGLLAWQIDTGPGPLLSSNIHNLELTDNGQWIRFIPSLSGSIYRFDGVNIDALPLTADALLKSTLNIAKDVVIAGGYEIRTYGVAVHSGTPLYECSAANCKNITDNDGQYDDVILIERSSQTVRAVEPVSGIEKWNFSVGLHDVKIPLISCVNVEKFRFKLSAVLPDGLLIATGESSEIIWQYQFSSPIVNIWKWNGKEVEEVNLFTVSRENDATDVAQIYIGMHNKQPYIHESSYMKDLDFFKRSEVAVSIPFKPIPANDVAVVNEVESTALSVLYASEYANGKGYYFTYNSPRTKPTYYSCKNKTNETLTIPDDLIEEDFTSNSFIYWWREVLVISMTTAMIFNVMIRSLWHRRPKQEVIFVERHIKVPVLEEVSTGRTISESSDIFCSRYINDFETVSCLGKGGFGVVFQAKQKIDECNYAIKRITLPPEKESRDRVMREVKALAKLDHHNIVRYFNSWVENPPHEWHVEHDKQFIPESTTTNLTTGDITQSSHLIPQHSTNTSNSKLPSFHNNNNNTDSFIVFEGNGDISNSTLPSTTAAGHFQKKTNWRRPGRRSHSLDGTAVTGMLMEVHPPSAPVFLYIQMQLCRKESLRDWLKENKLRDFSQVLSIFGQILAAVEYVHLQGLIHRDLKPSNILFSLEGQIKVGDFGLVTDMCDSVENEFGVSHSPRGHTKAVGTRLYMSPEQLNNRQYNYKVDIYSLGLVFFELLFPFSTEMERIYILTDLRNKKYPETFSRKYLQERQLLDMMLCENPKRRPTTFGIKARPPLKLEGSEIPEELHFDLPSYRKMTEPVL